jgi:hypothetical protein
MNVLTVVVFTYCLQVHQPTPTPRPTPTPTPAYIYVCVGARACVHLLSALMYPNIVTLL